MSLIGPAALPREVAQMTSCTSVAGPTGDHRQWQVSGAATPASAYQRLDLFY